MDFIYFTYAIGNTATDYERIYPQRGIKTPAEGLDESMHALVAHYIATLGMGMFE